MKFASKDLMLCPIKGIRPWSYVLAYIPSYLADGYL